MKLHRSAVAVCAAAALTLTLPSAAHAGGHSTSAAKGKAAAAAKHQAQKAAKALAEAARKRAAEAKAHFTFPGTVTAVSATGLSVSRKERGVTVVRSFVLAPDALVKRDGLRIGLAAVQVGDKVVAHGHRVGGQLVVSRVIVAPATVVPVVSDTATATIVI